MLKINTLAWHLWRIATFRPAFGRLNDSPKTFFGFVACFAGALGIRMLVGVNGAALTEPQVASLLCGGVTLVVLLYATARLYGYSLSFAAGMLGAVTVSTLLACIAEAARPGSFDAYLAVLTGSVLLCLWTLLQFVCQPSCVRRQGYRFINFAG